MVLRDVLRELLACCHMCDYRYSPVRLLELQKLGMSSNELLGATAPSQAATLLLAGPAIDKLVTNSWVFNYRWHGAAVWALVVSCTLAVFVNISQYMCLGRFTATTFQVGPGSRP